MRSSSASQLISVLCKSNHIIRRICSFTMFHHYETMDEAVDEVHNLSDIAIPKVLVLQMVLWTFGWNWAVYQLAQHGSLVPFTPLTPTNPSPHPSPHGGRTVACTCQVCVACTCRVSVACTFSASIYAWDSQQLAGSKVVLSRDHVVQKKRRCWKYVIIPPTPPYDPQTISMFASPRYDIIPPTPSHPPHPSHHIRIHYYVCKSKYVIIPPTLPTHHPHSSMCASSRNVIIPPTPPKSSKGVCMYKWRSRSSCMYKWRRHAQVT